MRGEPSLQVVRVHSGSMEPSIPAGTSLGFVSGILPRSGDVAAIRTGEGLLVHRLIAKIDVGRRCWFVHRGDASLVCGIADSGEIEGVIPGMWKRAPAPRMLLLFQLGAILGHLGFRVPRFARRIFR